MTYLELYELSGKVGEVHFKPYSFTYGGDGDNILSKLEAGPFPVEYPVDSLDDFSQPVFEEDTRKESVLSRHEQLLSHPPITEIQRVDE